LGGKWDFEIDPELAAKKMIAHIDLKRKALGIDKARERVLFDMDMRREMAEAAATGEEH
jgi:carbon-monoxide dehydrogenase catalytic subunit